MCPSSIPLKWSNSLCKVVLNWCTPMCLLPQRAFRVLDCQGSSVCTLGADKSNSTPWLQLSSWTSSFGPRESAKTAFPGIPAGNPCDTRGIPKRATAGDAHPSVRKKMWGNHEAESRTRRALTPGRSSGSPSGTETAWDQHRRSLPKRGLVWGAPEASRLENAFSGSPNRATQKYLGSSSIILSVLKAG